MLLLIPLIVFGETGSRLWLLFREGHPKSFIELFDGKKLLEKNYHCASLLNNIPRINGKPFVLTITNREYYFISKNELEKTNPESLMSHQA